MHPLVLQICLPGLHMGLGIYDCLWELLEGACTELDLLEAQHSSSGGEENSFQEYVAALKERDNLDQKLATAEERVTALDQLVTFFSLHSPNPAHDQNLKALREASSRSLLGVAAVVIKSMRVAYTVYFCCTGQGNTEGGGIS